MEDKKEISEWWIKLSGEDNSIEFLQRLLAETNHKIIQDASGWLIRLDDLPYSSDLLVIIENTKQTIAILNGLGKLLHKNFSEIRSTSVFRFNNDGTKTAHYFLSPQTGSFKLISQPITEYRLSDSLLTAYQDEYVYRVLTLYGSLEHSFRNLYMILEIIEEDLGGETGLMSMDWVPNNIKEFKRTANSFQSIGSDSRHGKYKNIPPKNPMTESKAQELIRILVIKWLDYKQASINIPPHPSTSVL